MLTPNLGQVSFERIRPPILEQDSVFVLKCTIFCLTVTRFLGKANSFGARVRVKEVGCACGMLKAINILDRTNDFRGEELFYARH